MRILLLLFFNSILTTTLTQITKGSNFISVTANVINKDGDLLEEYRTDDSIQEYKVSGLINGFIGYNFLVTDKLSIGISGHFVAASNSTYKKYLVGPAFRYYLLPKSPSNPFLFLELAAYFGQEHLNTGSAFISEYSIRVGGTFKLNNASKPIFNHFGIEPAAGLLSVLSDNEGIRFQPMVSLGILFFLDSKKTSNE